MGFDGDPICIDFRAAAEGFLDLALDLAGRGARSHLYRIGDPLQAFYPPYSAFGRRPLIVPLDIAFEGDPAITNEHFKPVRHMRGATSSDRSARGVVLTSY